MDFHLDDIKIAAPCPADWSAMAGDDRVRFCGECRLNVYNLSDMTRQEAEELVRSREGHLCVRFYRRADGTMITRDCPKGAAVLHRRRIRGLVKTGVAMMAIVTLAGIFTLKSPAEELEKCPPKKDGKADQDAQPLMGSPIPPELMKGFWGPEPEEEEKTPTDEQETDGNR